MVPLMRECLARPDPDRVPGRMSAVHGGTAGHDAGRVAGGRTDTARGSREETTDMVEVGTEAPDFALRGADGAELRLSSLRGQGRALLIFYPKDLTSG